MKNLEENEMKIITISLGMSILIILITFLLFNEKTFAQQAGWVVQELPQTMTGSYLADRGDDVLICTKSNSDIVYFFDTRINIWTEANLGSQQNFQKVLGAGYTAFAYSNEYLVGYSSILSQWDTVKYQGNVIDPNGVSIHKGYGCGEMLAYFITDANIFYVFDSELAEWQIYSFGIVTNAGTYHKFWAADNYAGAILGRNGNDHAKNIAYSLITHSFAELDQGGWYHYPDNIMNGGYVAWWTDAVSWYSYFGYSATTNQFTSVTFPSGFDVLLFDVWIDQTSYDRLEDIYIYTCGYEVGDQINRDVTVRSYSTKTGNWYSLQYSYDPRDLSGGWGKRGGSFSLGWYVNDADYSVNVWKFYGKTGTHIGEGTGLFGTPYSPSFVCGGTVAIGIGNHNLWFHNFETAQSKNRYFPPNNDVFFSSALGAENYCVIFRINTTSDTMKAFFFNGNTNNLQSFNLLKGTNNPTGIASPRAYGAVIDNSDHEVIFYSEEKDSLIIYQAPQTIYGTLAVNNFLMGLTISTGNSVVFDANTVQTFEKNFSISNSNIGDSLIFVGSGDMELTAYSGITKNWTTQQTDQLVNGYQVGDEIAIAYSVSFAKCWGYSAYDDSYYELVPEGTFVSPYSMAGGKTAIVIRSNKIYAFTPGDVSPVREDVNTTVNNYSMYQNYPNPFNPSTTISWQQPEAGIVTLKIYDVLGREVTTLLNEELTAGKHEVIFDASRFSSGVYFYQVQAGKFLETKKMILIK
jgi:hypothetical protein